MAQYSSFVVKIRSVPNGGLRGQIVHVGTQEKRHFLDLERMVEFILEHLEPSELLRDTPVLAAEKDPPPRGDGNGDGNGWHR